MSLEKKIYASQDFVTEQTKDLATNESVSQSVKGLATENYVNNLVANKSDSGHTHDDRYYTESEIDGKLAGKSDTGHTHSEYANQNAFSNVKVGSATIVADSTTDTLTLVAGSNVIITPDATNDKLTIAATDTVYTHPTTSGNKHIPSGGSSGQILRWSADGTAVWGADNDTTYSNFVKSGSGAKAGLVPAPSTTAGTTKYLREDGTWTTPPDTTYSAATQSAQGLMSAADKTKLDGIATGANKITVDSALSSTSTNPVQNKVVNTAISNLNTLIGNQKVSEQISGAISGVKGAANGLAELDANGKVPSTQLPSYVDDVVEASSQSAFPATGEAGKIYIATDTNKTYRWSGSAYVEISASLALGTTSSTAYRGDYGAAAYKHAVTNKGTALSSGLYKVTTNSEGHVTAGTAVTKSDITGLGIPAQDTTYNAATQSAAGLMSAADKTKLDGIATGANKITVDTALSSTSTNPVQNKAVNTAISNLNTLVGNTAVSTQIANAINGVTLSSLGVTATAAELNKLDGVTATTTELNYVDGVTSNIQTQLNAKSDSGHTHSEYVNQNAFSNVKVGSTTVAADTATDTLTLAGSNVTLTPDTTNDKVTIGITKDNVVAALGYTPPTTDTTYSAAGTSLGLVKSGGDVTISSGVITVNDDSHNHTIANVDGLQDKLNLIGDTAVSTQISNAIANKVDKVSGKGLSTNDYTTTEKNKLAATNVAYGTCSTAAATAAKVITISGNTNWALTPGSIITVEFTETNTASNPTFNVNGTGAKPVQYGTAALTTSSLSYAGYKDRPIIYVYDGTNYVFVGWSYDANTTYTNVKLGHGYATCSTAAATTAKVASLSSYTLTTGGIVAVKFTNDVPASATLNINSKGAKAIYHRGAAIKAGVIQAGDTATFIYSSRYHLISIDRDEINDVVSFDIFPTEEQINALSHNTYFSTKGFYSKYDGLACTYQVKDTSRAFYVQHGNKYFTPVISADGVNRDLYVDYYGVRRTIPTLDSSGHFTYNDAHEEKNSQIMDELIAGMVNETKNGITIHFNSGHYCFSNPLIFNPSGKKIHVTIKGASTNAMGNSYAINYGTALHFPNLVDGQAAISLYGGNVYNLGLIGNRNICDYDMTGRTEGIPPSELVITSVDNGTIYGIKTEGGGHVIQNVRLTHFTYGIYGVTTTALLSHIQIKKCKIGISAGGDWQINNVQVEDSVIGLQLRNTLINAVNIRGDSIIKHLIECQSGKANLSNIDGDYCLGSLIHYGGHSHMIHLGSVSNCVGRAAIMYSFERGETFDLTNVPAEDYEYCSMISIAPDTSVFGGDIDISNMCANIGDVAGVYVHPAAVISIGEDSTVKNVSIRCNIPKDANEDYFNTQVIKNLSTYAESSNDTRNYITDFDGKTIEDINFITPHGFIKSTRTISVPDRKLEITSDLHQRVSDTIKPKSVLVLGPNLNDGVYETGTFRQADGTEYNGYHTMAFRSKNYIPVEGGRTICLHYDKAVWNNNNIGLSFNYVEYDANKNIISGGTKTFGQYGHGRGYSYVLQDNTAYIRITFNLWSEIPDLANILGDIKAAVYYFEDVLPYFKEYGYVPVLKNFVEGERVMLKSPNGTTYTLTINDSGVLSVTPLGS